LTDLKIKPTKLSGNVTVPPSKSLAHRAIISAGLAEGTSEIHNIQFSDDMIATINGMRALGAKIEKKQNSITVEGIGSFNAIENQIIDCNESGSTLRFLMPISTLFSGETRFIGRGKLGERPLDAYEEIFKEQGISYTPSGIGRLDTKISGSLKPGDYFVSGDVSSQFITGMLFTLPLLGGGSTLTITTSLESVGYIELTLSVLRAFGVQVDHNNYRRFKIPGNQQYTARDYEIEGDFSQAAFFLSAGALGSDVKVDGLNHYSLQGDQEIIDILEQLNAEFEVDEDSIQARSQELNGDVEIDGSQVPDIIPVVALVASLSKGKTVIKNLSRLRIKESDRLMATQVELAALGANIKIVDNELHIEGVSELQGGVEVWSHKDHRIAMMLGIASTVCKEPIIVKDSESVAKSYPDFWKDFKTLGGKAVDRNLG